MANLYVKLCEWQCIGRPVDRIQTELKNLYFTSQFPLCSGGSGNVVIYSNNCVQKTVYS